MTDPVRPNLIFTWGNPSRGDDAIGPIIHERLGKAGLEDVDLLTDFQLQVEHAIDLEHRERILFVDASASAKAPFEFSVLRAETDHSYTTHAMSPSALLAVYEQVNRMTPPPAFMLSVRGYRFGLGETVSGQANDNIDATVAFIQSLLADAASTDWCAIASRDRAP